MTEMCDPIKFTCKPGKFGHSLPLSQKSCKPLKWFQEGRPRVLRALLNAERSEKLKFEGLGRFSTKGFALAYHAQRHGGHVGIEIRAQRGVCKIC